MASRDELMTTHVGPRRRRIRRRIVARAAAAVALIGALGMTAAACESQTEQDPTPVKTFKITPAAQSPTVGSASATASPTGAAGETATPSAAGATLELTASGQTLKFDKAKLSAPAGPVTIMFDHKDAGVVHNVHVFKGTDAKGESVGNTELEVGPIKQELKLDLQPGTYYYQCDAHPTTMKGTLTVG